MNEKDKILNEYNDKITKRIFKSLLYTLIMFVISIWGIYSIIALIFGEMSVEQSDTWAILSLGIGIIFTIFYCTLTILEALKK